MTGKLPLEAKLWIKGESEPTEAWERLDKLYGDKELAVLSTMYSLESFELPQGSAHEVIQALALELRISMTWLEAVGDGSKLYANYLTIGRLVSKLDQATQVRWFKHRASEKDPEH